LCFSFGFSEFIRLGARCELPNFIFIITSVERYLRGEGCSIAVHELPLNCAITLIERELGRALTLEERPAAETLCKILNGHPQQILKAAAQVREKNVSLLEVTHQLQSTSPINALDWQILTSLSQPQRVTLQALTALGTWFLPEYAAALTGLTDIQAILNTLMRYNLIQTDGFRYKVTKTVGETLQQVQNLTPFRKHALSYFINWAEQNCLSSSFILEETNTLLQILKQSVTANCWIDVLHLCRIVENAFAFNQRWGSWAQILNYALQAARATSDRASEAWALHQLGTYAICLEDMNLAHELLTQALQLRELLGDETGARLLIL
jgi:hypothetical protein